jgi:hypothetical protein
MAKTTKTPKKQASRGKAAAPTPNRKGATKAKGPGKAETVFLMLSRPQGTSITELTKKLGVLPHTARAYVSVESRKHGRKAALEGGRYRLA